MLAVSTMQSPNTCKAVFLYYRSNLGCIDLLLHLRVQYLCQHTGAQCTQPDAAETVTWQNCNLIRLSTAGILTTAMESRQVHLFCCLWGIWQGIRLSSGKSHWQGQCVEPIQRPPQIGSNGSVSLYTAQSSRDISGSCCTAGKGTLQHWRR